jgi:hypothetical protein
MVALALEVVRSGQLMHCVAPLTFVNVPALQPVHCEPLQWLPASQSVHDVAAEVETVPDGHDKQLWTPLATSVTPTLYWFDPHAWLAPLLAK